MVDRGLEGRKRDKQQMEWGLFLAVGETPEDETRVNRKAQSQGKVSGRELQKEGATSAKVHAGRSLAYLKDREKAGLAKAQRGGERLQKVRRGREEPDQARFL